MFDRCVVDGLVSYFSAGAGFGFRQNTATTLASKQFRPNSLLRSKVEASELEVTVSIGVAVVRPDPSHPLEVSVSELVEQADLALYQAKHDGRNKVCFYGLGSLYRSLVMPLQGNHKCLVGRCAVEHFLIGVEQLSGTASWYHIDPFINVRQE
jgi:hypothetical protein